MHLVFTYFHQFCGFCGTLFGVLWFNIVYLYCYWHINLPYLGDGKRCSQKVYAGYIKQLDILTLYMVSLVQVSF